MRVYLLYLLMYLLYLRMRVVYNVFTTVFTYEGSILMLYTVLYLLMCMYTVFTYEVNLYTVFTYEGFTIVWILSYVTLSRNNGCVFNPSAVSTKPLLIGTSFQRSSKRTSFQTKSGVLIVSDFKNGRFSNSPVSIFNTTMSFCPYHCLQHSALFILYFTPYSRTQYLCRSLECSVWFSECLIIIPSLAMYSRAWRTFEATSIAFLIKELLIKEVPKGKLSKIK